MNVYTRIFGFGLLVAFVAGSYAQESCPAIKELRLKLHEKPFITLQFSQQTYSDVFESVDTLSGKLWTGKGGRFRLSTPNQVMVSNGILFWSYSVENQQVLVDSVTTLGQWDPLTLLYDPEAIYSCRAQRENKGKLELDMAAVDSLTVPARFTLQISRPDYRPEKLTYRDDNGSLIEVVIADFAGKDRLPDSLFEFNPAPGVEVIQMP
ncbi:MAG: outer membrane lipoprotein carrier protein LolA [candidate division Zixibacteria bacterium]|nr:outer membrane lipoprotein carrier protein LolA [candidate division Zixibacteria bacterium]